MWQLKVSDSKSSYEHEEMKILEGKNHINKADTITKCSRQDIE